MSSVRQPCSQCLQPVKPIICSPSKSSHNFRQNQSFRKTVQKILQAFFGSCESQCLQLSVIISQKVVDNTKTGLLGSKQPCTRSGERWGFDCFLCRFSKALPLASITGESSVRFMVTYKRNAYHIYEVGIKKNGDTVIKLDFGI